MRCRPGERRLRGLVPEPGGGGGCWAASTGLRVAVIRLDRDGPDVLSPSWTVAPTLWEGTGWVGFEPVSVRCRYGTASWMMGRRRGRPIEMRRVFPSQVTSVRTTINATSAMARRRGTVDQTYDNMSRASTPSVSGFLSRSACFSVTASPRIATEERPRAALRRLVVSVPLIAGGGRRAYAAAPAASSSTCLCSR